MGAEHNLGSDAENELLRLNADLEARVTERTEALRQSTQLLRLHFEQTPLAVIEWDLEFRVTKWNPAAERIFGYTPAEAVGQHASFIVPASARPQVDQLWRALLEQRGGQRSTNWNVHRTGGEILCDWYNTPLVDAQGQIIGVASSVNDVTETHSAEESLRASEARFRLFFDHSPDAIFVEDEQGTVLDVNTAACRLQGATAENLIGQSVFDLVPPEARDRTRQTFSKWFTGQLSRADGQAYNHAARKSVPVEIHGTRIEYQGRPAVLLHVRDVSERKEIERQLLRNQRLESIGTLAGGIAHDLNNALAPVLMGLDMLRRQYPDAAAPVLDNIEASTKRGADMVKQLVTFARGAEGQRTALAPAQLLNEMEKIITGTFPKNIQLTLEPGAELNPVMGDVTQLHQVLLNLCVNARDAMPHGGKLTLAAQNLTVDEAAAARLRLGQTGQYVVLRVADSGSGIPAEIVDRIFEPFFTTKGPDKGTGLGLSTVMGIVRGHGGFVLVESTPGRGATFSVYLPTQPAGTEAIRHEEMDSHFRGQGETVLVVDDEKHVREVAAAVLERLNFQVVTSTDGSDALIRITEHRSTLKLIITDLHMPHMDGLAFVRLARRIVPRAGIIVVSGRIDPAQEQQFQALGITTVLEKPFTEQCLVRAVQATLAESVR